MMQLNPRCIYVFFSQVSRVLEASILMELNLQSGTQKTIHIPLSQFQNLRYQVATCLKQFNKNSI